MMVQATLNVNGLISDEKEAVVSVLDHGFLFGEGVYETLRTYNHQPFLLDRHLKRLNQSAEMIGLSVPLTNKEVAFRISETMDVSQISEERYIRLLLTRGVGDLSYDPSVCRKPSFIIIVKPHEETPQELLAKGISIILSSVKRNHPEAINPRIKSNNLLNNALAMQEAIKKNADEALMRNYRGEISECAQSNFFLVSKNEVLTASLDSGLLQGVTRDFVLEIASEIGVTARETTLLDEDLSAADEMFITSTTREILPVTIINNKQVGSGRPGPLTLELRKEFYKRVSVLTSKAVDA